MADTEVGSGLEIVGGIALAAAIWPVQAWVFYLAWSYFIDPVWHFPLTYWQAFGVIITYDCIVGFRNRKEKYETVLGTAIAALFSTAFQLLIVWLMSGINRF